MVSYSDRSTVDLPPAAAPCSSADTLWIRILPSCRVMVMVTCWIISEERESEDRFRIISVLHMVRTPSLLSTAENGQGFPVLPLLSSMPISGGSAGILSLPSPSACRGRPEAAI